MTATTELATLFNRDPTQASVLVADGYGVALTVSRGHLVIHDGIGAHRRVRRLPRAQRTVRRIVVIGHTGHVTLEAVRWCFDTGIAILQLDTDGTTLLCAGKPGIDDARLRRAQAAAPADRVGVEIAQKLLGAKLAGQAAVLADCLDAGHVAGVVRGLAEQLQASDDLVRCRDLEAQASNVYFASWSTTVSCRFAERDAAHVPAHWTVFATRGSPLHAGGRSPRKAADPVNAMLNYGYALAEAEAKFAATAVGLDPGLGIVHTDKRNRDSFALDLLEPLRPVVERHVLRLLDVRHFRHTDFHETRDGSCRLVPPLTHELAEHVPAYAREVAPHAEFVAHTLAISSPGKIELRTPLSRRNTKAAQAHLGQRPLPASQGQVIAPMPSCRACGTGLTDRGRQLCSSCWTVTRRQLSSQRAEAGQASIAKRRAAGDDPTNTPAAAAKRAGSLSRRRREELAWEAAHPFGQSPDDISQETYLVEVQPALANVPLSGLVTATGLSISACSRIRSGGLVPHRRHWEPLSVLGKFKLGSGA